MRVCLFPDAAFQRWWPICLFGQLLTASVR